MKKQKTNIYYSAFVHMADCTVRAAAELERLMRNFNPCDLESALAPLHSVENEADGVLHATKEKLLHEFITPIDRDDILSILNTFDGVVDDIEDIAIKARIFDISAVRPECLELCAVISECALALKELAMEFPDFKRSERLKELFVLVNSLEEKGDRIYFKAMRRLYAEGKDAVEILKWSQIFDALEACCDACEHTAGCIECAVFDNT